MIYKLVKQNCIVKGLDKKLTEPNFFLWVSFEILKSGGSSKLMCRWSTHILAITSLSKSYVRFGNHIFS